LLLGKLEEEENNIILQMRKDFAILQKKSHIHEREIKRIQGLVTKYANVSGLFLGDLRREKTRNKQQNDIMAISKNVASMKVCYSPELPKNGSKDKNKYPPVSPIIKKCKIIFILFFSKSELKYL